MPLYHTYEYHIIEVTGIPAEYNEREAYVRIGSEIMQGGRGEAISDGKFIGEICTRACGGLFWHGYGSFPIIIMILEDATYGSDVFMLPKDNVFIYTNGETFQELQIDICALTGNINDLPSDFFDKLPKIEFLTPEIENTVTVIEFDKLQKLDYTGCELEEF
jgi:hypothetical protein